jgi:hypothetical protein
MSFKPIVNHLDSVRGKRLTYNHQYYNYFNCPIEFDKQDEMRILKKFRLIFRGQQYYGNTSDTIIVTLRLIDSRMESIYNKDFVIKGFDYRYDKLLSGVVDFLNDVSRGIKIQKLI